MYAAGAEHQLKAHCVALLRAVAAGDLRAVTNVEVHQEILHRYSALGERERAVAVARQFRVVVPDVLPVTAADLAIAYDLHLRYADLPTRDLIHLAVMKRNGIRRIVSADRHFDELDELVRVDPALWPIPPESKASDAGE
jgi:predicted nucleic acid-binding protein